MFDYDLRIDSVTQGESTDGNPNHKIEIATFHWTANAGQVHSLQSLPSLSASQPTWTTIDSFNANTTGTINTQVALPTGTTPQFFRLLLPQVQINLLQPNIVPTTGGNFFIIGQLFNASDTVQIDGVSVSSMFIDSNTIMVTAGVLTAGFHTVTVLDSMNNVIASSPNGLNVTTTGRTDQGSPPTAPIVNCPNRFGSPSFRWTSLTGADRYWLDLGSPSTSYGSGSLGVSRNPWPETRGGRSGSNSPFLDFRFGTVFTTKIDWSGSSGDEAPTESLSFVYGALGIEYTPSHTPPQGKGKAFVGQSNGVIQQWNSDALRLSRFWVFPGFMGLYSPVNLVVGSAKRHTVSADGTIVVGSAREHTVNADGTIVVGSAREHTVNADGTIVVGSAREHTVNADGTIVVGSAREHTVNADGTIVVGSAREHTVSADGTIVVGSAREHTVSADRNLSVGAAKEQPLFGLPNDNEATGELFVRSEDVRVPGRGLDFVWARTYRSKIGLTTPMGANWDSSYNIRIAQSGSNMTVQDGQNRTDIFFPQSDGSFVNPELFRRITCSGTTPTCIEQFADNTQWAFNPLDGSPSAGKIARIVDRNGNQLQCQYLPTSGQLGTIIDTLGHPFSVIYDVNGFISQLHDGAGNRTWTYQHLTSTIPGVGSAGDLMQVSSPAVTGTVTNNDFPSGKTAQFTYTTGFSDAARNHNLSSIRDGNNVLWFQATYTTNSTSTDFLYDRVATETIGTNNETKVFYYNPVTPSASNGFATTETIVNDPLGHVCESLFDSQNRLVDLKQYTGASTPGVQVTNTSNRPTNPVRTTDPAFFETRVEWNSNSLPTLVILPRGNGEQFVYQRDIDPAANPLVRANLRVMRQLPVTGSPLVDRWNYSPGYGTVERFQSDGNDLFDVFQLYTLYYGEAYPTSHTDARGFTTTGTRDTNGNLTGVTGPDLVTVSLGHNGNGQLTSITEPPNSSGHSEIIQFNYFTSGATTGYLQSIIQDAGGLNLTTNFAENNVGDITSITDARGNDTQFSINQLDQIVQIMSRNAGTPGRYTTNIFYDANNNITHMDVQNKDENGNLGTPNFFLTTVTRDSLDHPTQITETVTSSHNINTQIIYDAVRNPIMILWPLAVAGTDVNAKVQLAWDERNLPFTITAAPGTSIATRAKYSYDQNGNLTEVDTGAPSGGQHVATATFDGFDYPDLITNTIGTQFQIGRNADHQVTSLAALGVFLDQNGSPATGPLGSRTITYASTGNPTQIIDSFFDVITGLPIGDGARTTTCSYDSALNLISVTDDNNHTTTRSYDGANRPSRVTDAKSNRIDYVYDGNNNIITSTETDKSDIGGPDQVFTRTNVYDGVDRPITSTDNVGNAGSYRYDSRGNLVRYTDPRNNLTQYQYDGLNRLIQRGRDMNGNGSGFDAGTDIIHIYTHDDNSRLIGDTDPNSHATQYIYDSLGRPTHRTNADSTGRSWTHDAWGNPIQVNDENGTVVANTFDNDNRLTQSQITPAAGVSSATTFENYTYDGVGRVQRAVNDSATVRFNYDSLGRPTSEQVNGRTTFYTYDGVGNLITLQSPGGRVATYSYDAANLCSDLSLTATSDGDSLNEMAIFRYVGDRMEFVGHRNGVGTLFTYDGFVGAPSGSDHGWRQLSGITTEGPSSNVIDQRIFIYDARGNVIERDDTRSGGPQLDDIYTYDPANRDTHTQVNSPGPTLVRDTAYVYDLNVNRVSVSGTGTPNAGAYTMDATTPQPADAQENQYTTTPLGNYTYDMNGNRISVTTGAGLTYKYDYANRLIDITNTTTSVRIAHYDYDASGRRATKTLNPDAPTPSVTNYVYAGPVVLEERDGNGNVNASYTPFAPSVRGFNLDEPAWVQPSRGVEADESHWIGYSRPTMIEMRRSGNNFTFDMSASSSIWLVTNASGAPAERYDYEDYGDPHIFNPSGTPLTSSAIGNPYFFRGMRFDSETGLYLGVSSMMFDPKIAASLEREPTHATNVWPANGTGMLWDDNSDHFTIKMPIPGNRLDPMYVP
jgi:YD repeat-containing protein